MRASTGRIILFGKEPERPAERRWLSKDHLRGKSERDNICVHPQAWYAGQEAGLRTSTKVTGIDPSSRRSV